MASGARRFERSNALRARAHEIIPGGAHTYAKGDDQYPILSPGFIARGQGCRVWDVDGGEYIEYGMGNRAVALGHAYEPVLRAARDALPLGANFTRPAAIEVEAAEAFLDLVPNAEMVKFCKDGSDATSGAIRLARAYTGRDYVAICGDHPFFSVDDWFIGTMAMNAGIPQDTQSLTLKFRYNDIASVRALFEAHPGAIACLILEPMRNDPPQDGFLHAVQQECRKHGALFILDEMICGFRWHKSGGQGYLNIDPDLSTWGKAMGNGFAVSALAGKREFMRLGGLDHTDKPRTFLLSTTHGGETHALAAAIAVISIYKTEPVIEHLYAMGERLRRRATEVIARHGLSAHVAVQGHAPCLVYSTLDQHGQPSQAFRSLFLQELIRHGVLAPSLVVSYSHTEADIDATVEAMDKALIMYGRALADGVEKYLIGRPSAIVNRAYNTAPR